MKRNIGFYWRNRKKIPYYLFINELERALQGCESVLDLACGASSPLQHLTRNFFLVGCDRFKPALEKSRRAGIHDQYIQLDVVDLDGRFPAKSFDCVLALDLIEHLEKEEGARLIAAMEKIAKRRVIIFTPNGFLPQGEFSGNPWQVHRSGWSVTEMKGKGFQVIGVMGWKRLRGDKGGLKFSPKGFWSLISALTQVFIKRRPEQAFQILCSKELA